MNSHLSKYFRRLFPLMLLTAAIPVFFSCNEEPLPTGEKTEEPADLDSIRTAPPSPITIKKVEYTYDNFDEEYCLFECSMLECIITVEGMERLLIFAGELDSDPALNDGFFYSFEVHPPDFTLIEKNTYRIRLANFQWEHKFYLAAYNDLGCSESAPIYIKEYIDPELSKRIADWWNVN